VANNYLFVIVCVGAGLDGLRDGHHEHSQTRVGFYRQQNALQLILTISVGLIGSLRLVNIPDRLSGVSALRIFFPGLDAYRTEYNRD